MNILLPNDIARPETQARSSALFRKAVVMAAVSRVTQAAVANVESGLEAMQTRFQAMDRHMSSAALVATRIGDRLQACDKQCIFFSPTHHPRWPPGHNAMISSLPANRLLYLLLSYNEPSNRRGS